MGLEPTPELYVTHIVEVFREVRRVLRKDGTLWLVLGDCYSAQRWTDDSPQRMNKFRDVHRGIAPEKITGLPPKNLVGIPWLVAFALQADGWWLRSDIIWAKPNPMPESVTDRPTRSHEYIFLLTKSERYFYDAAAIAESQVTPINTKSSQTFGASGGKAEHIYGAKVSGDKWVPNGFRNKRDVWTIPVQPFPEAHFATFPVALAETCIKAGSKPGDIVLDPFLGSGTTGLVAYHLGRGFIGIELNPEYVEMARQRIVGPLFSGAEAGA